MSLKKMALIAEVLGGLGIIVSILYLAYEISENSETMGLSHHLTLSQQALELRQSLMENDGFARVITKGNSSFADLEPFEKLQFENYYISIWDIWENAYHMSVTGQIDQEAWADWNSAHCSVVAIPGSAEVWAQGREVLYHPEFAVIVNQCYEQANLPVADIEK